MHWCGGDIAKARVLLLKEHVDRSDLAVSIFANNYLGGLLKLGKKVLAFIIIYLGCCLALFLVLLLLQIDLVPIDKKDDVGVLLDRA